MGDTDDNGVVDVLEDVEDDDEAEMAEDVEALG